MPGSHRNLLLKTPRSRNWLNTWADKGTVSAVLNDSPYARAIPQHTKDRILRRARELNYHPNFFAGSLRKKRTFTLGVIAAEIGDAYGSVVISGIEGALSDQKYVFVTVVHHHDTHLLRQYTDILRVRGVEGFITIDTDLSNNSPPSHNRDFRTPLP